MLRSLVPMSEHLGIMGSSAKDVPTKPTAKPRSALERILEHGYEFISTSARSLLIGNDDDDLPPINTSSNNNTAASFVDTTTTTTPAAACLPPQNIVSNVSSNSAVATADGGDEVLPAEFYNLFGGCAM